MKTNLHDMMQQKLSDFQDRMTAFETLVEEKSLSFENRVRQNEMNTVWRIRDCEELLK